MKIENDKNQVLFLLQEGWCYKKISKKTNFSKDCVRCICLQRSIGNPMKRGPKPKLNSAYKLRLNRKICNSKHIGKKGKLQEIDKLV